MSCFMNWSRTSKKLFSSGSIDRILTVLPDDIFVPVINGCADDKMIFSRFLAKAFPIFETGRESRRNPFRFTV